MKNILRTLICLLIALVLAVAPMALAETVPETTAAADEAAATEAPADEAAATEAPADEAAATEAPADETAAEPTVVEFAQEEEEETVLQQMLGNLTGMHWYTAVIVAVLLVMGIMLTKKSQWTTRRLAYAAMCVAIAFVLSCIKLFRMPQGGSVTPAAMLPLILFCLACGPVQGLAVGCAFGLLQLIEDPYVIHPIQLILDYPAAYGAMCVACLANLLPEKAKRFRLPLGVALGYLARLVMAVLSGVIFFAEYAGDQNVILYSLGYNAAYLAPEMVIAVLISIIPGMSHLVDTIRGKKA